MSYLWDTNTVIYFLQQQFPIAAEKFIDQILLDNDPAISAITEIELLCWKTATPSDIETINQFIQQSTVFELEQSVKIKTATIRKTHNIKLPDAIIAATALVYDLTLLTRNIKDFNRVEGLKVINVFEV